MPIFNYKCKKCGNTFEKMTGVISEEEELKCSKCSSKEIEKILSTFSVGAGRSSTPAPSCSTGSCNTGMCGLG
ncbi:MAG: zinc ribbon domain-containing protein [Elusimicrobia bacterium]|jgi:putative FmdB family regulatory protein|nr:zinc ribbon domain-containing protein [Elusimicrobiota bacterium]